MLLCPLREVTRRAKHLAVFRGRVTTLRPRLDVVCVHLVNVELLATHLTHPTLPCIGSKLLRFSECANGQAPLALSKHLWDNATLLCHVIVHKEFGDLPFECLCVKHLRSILLVECSPIDALEYLQSVFRMDECRFNPTYD